jgi:hypothetical protein
MASDEKTAKTETAPKAEASTSTEKRDSAGSSEGASSGASRGERQKPISKAYRDNWNEIFGKKKKKR